MRGALLLSLVVCLHFASACVTWESIQKRCQSWVDQKLPYSQQKTHDGYRMDCSGMVSWCVFGGAGTHKPGYTVRMFLPTARQIQKAELKHGDVLANPKAHMLMFVQWANSAQSKYYAYEECHSYGAVYRVVTYPYFKGWDEANYHPYRLGADAEVC